MPAVKPKKKNGQAKPAVKPVVRPVEDREITYADLAVNGVVIPRERLKITWARMKELLGWETESEFKRRRLKEDPTLVEEEVRFARDADDERKGAPAPLLTDENGELVVAWNNLTNREFNKAWAKSRAQEILQRRWRINGETVIIGQRRRALSIQHRGAGLGLAVQMWRADPAKYPLWAEEPWIESLVVTGISEDDMTVQTLDDTLARTDADTIQASEVFLDLDRHARRECSRMLAKATHFLWVRTGVQGAIETHPERRAFRDRHPSLIKAVRHVHEQNKDRVISALRLSPGECAGTMILMAAGATEINVYRLAEPAPSESICDMGLWDRAWEFWCEVARGCGKKPSKAFEPLRQVLLGLADDGAGGRAVEKSVVLAKAWRLFRDRHRLSAEDITPKYVTDEDGVKQLAEWPDFGGIDMGPEKEELEADEQEVETRKMDASEKKRMREQLGQEARRIAAGPPKKFPAIASRTTAEELDEVRAHPDNEGKVLFFRQSSGAGWTAWGDDAREVAKLSLGIAMNVQDGVGKAFVPAAKLEDAVAKLAAKGFAGVRFLDHLGQPLPSDNGENEKPKQAPPKPAVKQRPRPVARAKK